MPRCITLTALLMTGLITVVTGVYFGHRATEPKTPADTTIVALYSGKLPDTNDAPLDLAALRDQLVVINSWAPWRGLCVEEMPELSALTQEQKAKTKLIGIGIDSAPSIQALLGKIYVAHPIAMVGFGGAELGRQLGNGVGGLPFIVILSAQDEVTFRKMGRTHADELRETLQRT